MKHTARGLGLIRSFFVVLQNTARLEEQCLRRYGIRRKLFCGKRQYRKRSRSARHRSRVFRTKTSEIAIKPTQDLCRDVKFFAFVRVSFGWVALAPEIYLFGRSYLREYVQDLSRRKKIVVPRLNDKHRRLRLPILVQNFHPAGVFLCDRASAELLLYAL